MESFLCDIQMLFWSVVILISPDKSTALQAPLCPILKAALVLYLEPTHSFRFIRNLSDRRRLKLLTNLVEAHVLRTIRDGYQVKLDKVRIALDYMIQQFNATHPLVMKRFQTDGVDLFVDEIERRGKGFPPISSLNFIMLAIPLMILPMNMTVHRFRLSLLSTSNLNIEPRDSLCPACFLH